MANLQTVAGDSSRCCALQPMDEFGAAAVQDGRVTVNPWDEQNINLMILSLNRVLID